MGIRIAALLSLICLRSAVAQELPADALLFASNRDGNYEIFSMDPDGTNQRRLTRDGAHDNWWPKPSPDRRKILFTRAPRGRHDQYEYASTWVMDADGGNPHPLLERGAFGWKLQAHPEWSPDGRQIAIVGGPKSNPQVFIINADGKQPFRLTSNGRGGNRGGTNIDPSWHPDGNSLLFIGCPRAWCLRSGYEVYRIRKDGTEETRLTFNDKPDFDPYYSPSATTIAWLENTGSVLHWSIRRMDPDGSGTATVIDDGGINSKPAWSHDSQWIYFHRLPPKSSGGFSLWRIRPDGTGLHELIQPRPAYVNEYPVNALH